MKTINERERPVRKTEKHIRHLVLNVRDLPAPLAFDLAFVTGSSVGNATWLALLRHSLAFTHIRRAGQRTSGFDPLFVHEAFFGCRATGKKDQPWDWFAGCQHTVTKWYGKVDRQLLFQRGGKYTCRSRSAPEIH